MDPPEPSAEEPTRVLVADDHALFRRGLKAMFASVPEYEVVGEAATGEEALEKVANTHPDIVLMDIQMAKMNGIEATRRIVEAYPRTGVVMLTMFGDDDSIFAAMRAGARGYVLKGADEQEVLGVVGAVQKGEAHFGPEIAKRLMSYFSAPKGSPSSEAFPELTSREVEVLDLITRGAPTPR
jgi:DNA-binding NarL/FixJ family response regulator